MIVDYGQMSRLYPQTGTNNRIEEKGLINNDNNLQLKTKRGEAKTIRNSKLNKKARRIKENLNLKVNHLSHSGIYLLSNLKKYLMEYPSLRFSYEEQNMKWGSTKREKNKRG